MTLARCENGHYYDGGKYTSCPHCGIKLQNEALLKTIAIIPSKADSSSEALTVARKEPTEPETVARYSREDELKTVAKYGFSSGTKPVVGWLICSVGADKGADYRLYAGNNSIGRGDAPDIRIYSDTEISRGTHCTIVYDPNQNGFFVVAGAGTVTRLNGELVNEPRPLSRYDRICVGKTELVFVPYCEGGIHW